MSRTFTRIGKEITIAAKAGGPDPDTNPRLRALMQNAKAANMPKDTVERAIKKATDKDAGDYKEISYEGYGPHGIAIFVEAATDNNTRTVANVRSYFTKHGGSLGTQGSLTFLFDHKAVFKINAPADIDVDELENANVQKHLEDNGYEIVSTEFERIPNDLKDVTPEQREKVEKLLERIEEDEDVQNVFHNMRELDEEAE